MAGVLSSPQLWWFGYVLAFLATGSLCAFGMYQSTRIKDTATRWGVLWLCTFGGCWAFLHVVYLASVSPFWQYVMVVGGLIAALATLAAWLYTCSAYARRSMHRRTSVRVPAFVAVLVFAFAILTNPFHGYLFRLTATDVPFEFHAITPTSLGTFLLVSGILLALAGTLVVVHRLVTVDYETSALVGVIVLTLAPALLDLAQPWIPRLAPVVYAPFGVAPFVLGALYRYHERFQVVQLTGHLDHPILVTDVGGHVQHANQSALELFPATGDGQGKSIEELAPALAATLDGDTDVLELERDGQVRRYRVSTSPFASDATNLGQLVLIREATDEPRRDAAPDT